MIDLLLAVGIVVVMSLAYYWNRGVSHTEDRFKPFSKKGEREL